MVAAGKTLLATKTRSVILCSLCSLLARFFQIMKVKARTEDELLALKGGSTGAASSRPDVAEPKKAK